MRSSKTIDFSDDFNSCLNSFHFRSEICGRSLTRSPFSRRNQKENSNFINIHLRLISTYVLFSLKFLVSDWKKCRHQQKCRGLGAHKCRFSICRSFFVFFSNIKILVHWVSLELFNLTTPICYTSISPTFPYGTAKLISIFETFLIQVNPTMI